MSVHPRGKQKRIELPQESKLPSSTQHHLVREKKKKIKTSKSIMKKERERNTKTNQPARSTARKVSQKGLCSERKEEQSKMQHRWGTGTDTWKSQNSKATNNTAKCKPKQIATAKVDRNKEKKEKKGDDKKISKPPENVVQKISTLTKAAWGTKLQTSQDSVKTQDQEEGTRFTQNHCMLKTWSLDVSQKRSKPPRQMLKFKHQQKEEKQKKRGRQFKRRKKMLTKKKKSQWKCTHRAGVKGWNKNVKWLKIQYGGAMPKCCGFFFSRALQPPVVSRDSRSPDFQQWASSVEQLILTALRTPWLSPKSARSQSLSSHSYDWGSVFFFLVCVKGRKGKGGKKQKRRARKVSEPSLCRGSTQQALTAWTEV